MKRRLTGEQIASARRAPLAERWGQYVGGIQVQALLDHIASLESELPECPRCHGPNDHGDECITEIGRRRISRAGSPS